MILNKTILKSKLKSWEKNKQKIEIYFAFPHISKNNWRYTNKLGGAILDIGCYPISAILKLFDRQVKIIYKNININKNRGIVRFMPDDAIAGTASGGSSL